VKLQKTCQSPFKFQHRHPCVLAVVYHDFVAFPKWAWEKLLDDGVHLFDLSEKVADGVAEVSATVQHQAPA